MTTTLRSAIFEDRVVGADRGRLDSRSVTILATNPQSLVAAGAQFPLSADNRGRLW